MLLKQKIVKCLGILYWLGLFGNSCVIFLTDVAVQLSDGKDKIKDVSGEQKLIDWDKFRENILKWNEKKWAG